MLFLQNTKYLPAVTYASVTGAVTGLACDTDGYNYAMVVLKTEGAPANAWTSLSITECDTSGGSYTDITTPNTTVASGSTGNGRLPQVADDKVAFVWHIPLQGRKRYLKVAANTGAGATALRADVYLARAEVTPVSASESGVASIVFVG